ncbi:hypothetical protein MTR67_051465 [Solanum verrucosum]|uniref:Integrase catalytic domain-containing protein n=1 Tax=Solanum verrucosum TaxID=315347 RepID=A0AAF0V563_SOLVR|nr:hypothetical protein MTR67_051465 [Solanum verrucosum]
MKKLTHFILVKVSYSVEDYAKPNLREIVRLPGVPLSIISDCGTQFTSQGCGTHVKLSMDFHLQTNGKAERTIQTLEDMLRACVIDIKGPELVHEAMDEVWLIRERFKMAQSQQKSYDNVRRRDIEFDVMIGST